MIDFPLKTKVESQCDNATYLVWTGGMIGEEGGNILSHVYSSLRSRSLDQLGHWAGLDARIHQVFPVTCDPLRASVNHWELVNLVRRGGLQVVTERKRRSGRSVD